MRYWSKGYRRDVEEVQARQRASYWWICVSSEIFNLIGAYNKVELELNSFNRLDSNLI